METVKCKMENEKWGGFWEPQNRKLKNIKLENIKLQDEIHS